MIGPDSESQPFTKGGGMAVRLLVGTGGLIGTLKSSVPSKYWQVTDSDSPDAIINALLTNSSHAKGSSVFVNVSANWSRAQHAGWQIIWCGTRTRPPVGTMPLPRRMQEMALDDFAWRFWRVHVPDRRRVIDVITGRVTSMAPVMYVTGGSGGLSKTVSARRLAERAAAMRIPTLLVDANATQGSQWSYFHEPVGARTIADWQEGDKPTRGANQGRKFGVAYDLSFAPPSGVQIPWLHYQDYITRARETWGFVVVDLDHITADTIDDPDTAAGALLTPGVKGGDLCQYIIRAGVQTEADGLKVLGPMIDAGMPRENIGIKLIAPEGVHLNDTQEYERRYSKYGIFLGIDTFSSQAAMHLMNGDNNWPDPLLDYTREATLKWAFPDKGFTPERHQPKPQRKGLFG